MCPAPASTPLDQYRSLSLTFRFKFAPVTIPLLFFHFFSPLRKQFAYAIGSGISHPSPYPSSILLRFAAGRLALDRSGDARKSLRRRPLRAPSTDLVESSRLSSVRVSRAPKKSSEPVSDPAFEQEDGEEGVHYVDLGRQDRIPYQKIYQKPVGNGGGVREK
uniref:Uncharacterized protein n=1 Tax=Corethron hystrix TaxID=216773 RepID=A0A7S1BL69_9STRA